MSQFKPAIDSNLPPAILHTLSSWINRWIPMRNSPAGQVFALTGQYSEDGTDYRAAITLNNSGVRNAATITQVCDIDSVIGLAHQTLPLQDDALFDYHVLNDFRFCLTSEIHIPGWPDHRNPGKLLSYKDIPHAVFGTLDNNQTIIRIFFPCAIDELDGSVFLQDDMLGPFYDRAVLPAVRQIAADHYSRTWPPSYASEAARAAKVSGRPQFSGKQIRGEHVKAIIPLILQNIEAERCLSFAAGCFWMVEMKGLKNLSTHPPPEVALIDDEGNMIDPENQPRNVALGTVLRNWEWADFGPDWYLDFATTISTELPDMLMSTLIKKEAHPEIIRHFTRRPIDQCQRWASKDNGHAYQFDSTAHLAAAGGFRLTIHNPSPDEICYFQAYTTEKSLTFHRDGHNVSMSTSPVKVLTNWEKEKTRYFGALEQMYREAGAAETHSNIAVRFESRAPFDLYPLVHLRIPDITLRGWLFSLKTSHIQTYKSARIRSIADTISHTIANRHQAQHRHLSEILSLVVILVWMANAIACAPKSGGTWDEVRDAGSVHKLDPATQEAVAVQELGHYTLHSLRQDTVFRLSGHRVISDRTLLHAVFPGRKDAGVEDLYVLLFDPMENPGALQPPISWEDEPALVLEPLAKVQPASNNRRRRITLDVEEKQPLLFGTSEGQIPIPGIENQVINVDASDDEDTEVRATRLVTYEEVSNLVQKVAIQVFDKAPNHTTSNTSYCRLSGAEKSALTNQIFSSSSDLKSVWHSYTLFHDQDKWDKTVQRLFPDLAEFRSMTRNKDGKEIKIQGLSGMSFWMSWHVLLLRCSPGLREEVVQAVRFYINHDWHWFPVIEGNKLWNTAAKVRGHYGEWKTGPWLARNPRLC
ncbi:hypothetical protein FRC09_008340 [Ceratobasidium sp. 395]|nr:hypothetical protein FRC09_008340 [Ceratobasidium sp. 395]